MTVVATGSLSLPFAKAAELLAATAAFQSLCSVATAEQALPKIIYPYFDPSAELEDLPLAVLWKYPGLTKHRRGRLDAGSGSILLTIYALIPEEHRGNRQDDLLDWSNQVGAIIQQMLEKAQTYLPDESDWYWGLVNYEEVDPPGWLDEADTGISYCRVATYLLEWV